MLGLTMKDQGSQSLQVLACCEILSECAWPCHCLYFVEFKEQLCRALLVLICYGI